MPTSDCKPKHVFTFQYQLKSKVYAYKIGETDTIVMDMTNFYTYSGKNYAVEVVMQFGTTTNLISMEDSSMTLLMDMKMGDMEYKTGLCKKLNSKESAQSPMSETGAQVFNDTGFINQLKFTGNTKTVLGYACKEYSTSKDGIVFTVWATKDLPVLSSPELGENKKLKEIGGIMEMEMLSEKQEVFKSKAVVYSAEPIEISTVDYQF